MIKIKLTLIILISSILTSFGQSTSNYRSPVNFGIYLAGNLGEVRPNHFHSGIDIKALQGVGSPIYAVADGFISRVGVAPNGYGNFLAVTHNDGSTSVYAHLHDFAKNIKQLVVQEQLKQKKYAIDLYLKPSEIPVKNGDIIARLGNSGSSGGPHLHFEIRDRNANPINVISRKIYSVPDKERPICSKIYVYQCDTINHTPIFSLTQTIDFKRDKSGLHIPNTTEIKLSKKGYLAYEVIDYKDGKSNTMGIYSMKQSVDSVIGFEFVIDKISFETTRFINTFVQYNKNRESKRHVVRAYVSPNNKLEIYKNVTKSGLISPPMLGMKQALQTIIGDCAGNTTALNFTIVGDTVTKHRQLSNNEHIAHWSTANNLNINNLSVTIPFAALYDNEIIIIDTSNDIYTIGDEGIALHKNVTIRIKEDIAIKSQRHACLARVKPNGSLAYVGGNYANGEIIATTRIFGKHVIAYDSIAPTIKPMLANGATLKTGVIKFKINDDLSGIKKYNIFIDNQWVIGEYDPKNSLLSTEIALSKMPKKQFVKVVVSDAKGNTNTLETFYTW